MESIFDQLYVLGGEGGDRSVEVLTREEGWMLMDKPLQGSFIHGGSFGDNTPPPS